MNASPLLSRADTGTSSGAPDGTLFETHFFTISNKQGGFLAAAIGLPLGIQIATLRLTFF